MTRVQDYIDGIADQKMSRFTANVAGLFHDADQYAFHGISPTPDEDPCALIDFDQLLVNVIRFPANPANQ